MVDKLLSGSLCRLGCKVPFLTSLEDPESANESGNEVFTQNIPNIYIT